MRWSCARTSVRQREVADVDPSIQAVSEANGDHPIDVTVVIAARNESLHVREAVSSVAGQTGLSHELVFVDDGSTDDTYALVEELTREYENVRLVRNPGRGKVAAFNHGVSLGRGEWLCIFAGDDVMPAGSLAARWRAVRDIVADEPVVGLSRLQTISSNPKDHGHVIPKDASRGGYTGTSYLSNRAATSIMYPVPEGFPNEDTWLELVVSHLGWRVVHCGVVGCHWRVHPGNSINLRLPFRDFNARLTRRLEILPVFLDRFADAMPLHQRRVVEAKVRLERSRVRGSLLGIATSGAPLVEKLRSTAYSGATFYELRRRLYGLLSGW
jgi:glycosyltransferase involved in cell wall biosynthesis